MAYLVKDTYQYYGENTFNSLSEFVLHFGNVVDDITYFAVRSVGTFDEHRDEYVGYHTNNKIESWNTDTQVYERTLDFITQAKYNQYRGEMDDLMTTQSTDTRVTDQTHNYLNLTKTTEFL